MKQNENDTTEWPDALEKSGAVACQIERIVMPAGCDKCQRQQCPLECEHFEEMIAFANAQPAHGCICDGNWREIISESEPILDDLFADLSGAVHRFVGVMHSRDDYYYVMVSMAGEYRLSSCVGNLETNGYKPVEA